MPTWDFDTPGPVRLDLEIPFGRIEIETASGDVSLGEVGGQTQIQSTSGDVAIQRARGDVNAQLVSGDLWIRDASASVYANTVSGDQNFEAVVRGAVEATAISGDIHVGVR